jgi:hypothetical protein
MADIKQLNQLSEPSLTDLLDAATSRASRQLNCIQIGIIQTFYPETQTADIKFALKRVVSIDPDGTKTIQELPKLVNCPVMVLFGGGSYLTMPIASGDECILLFNDRDFGEWLVNGGVQVPTTFRIHDLSDGMAIVGLRNLQNSIGDYIAAGVRLSYSANSRITLTDDLIESIAGLFKHNGDLEVTNDATIDRDLLVKRNTHIEGGLQVDGIVTGSGGGGTIDINANITMHSGKTFSGGIVSSSNGATGTFTNSVTVLNGIVTGGT